MDLCSETVESFQNIHAGHMSLQTTNTVYIPILLNMCTHITYPLRCAGKGAKEGPWGHLYDVENDRNVVNFNPQTCMKSLRQHCPVLCSVLSQITVTPRDTESSIKTPEYKETMVFFALATALRLRSQNAIPVVAIFMSLTYYHSRMPKECMNAIAGVSSCCSSYRTLQNYLEKREKRVTERSLWVQKFPGNRFVMSLWDNFVKIDPRRYQRAGLKSYALIGTQMGARSLEHNLPQEALLLTAPKVGLTDATAESVWNTAKNPRLAGHLQAARKRELQASVIHASRTNGEKFPFPPFLKFPYRFEGESAKFQKSEIHPLPFSASDSGTREGTREIISDLQDMFHLSPPTVSWDMLGLVKPESGNFSFAVGDQLTYALVQGQIRESALMRGQRHSMFPVCGDLHGVMHSCQLIFQLYWDGGLGFIADKLKRTGVNKQMKGVYEVHHEFVLIVYRGVFEALLHAYKRSNELESLDPYDETCMSAFLTWVDECAKTDKVFAYWKHFLFEFCVLYFELRYAIRNDLGEIIPYLYFQLLPYMYIAKKPNYTQLIVDHLVDLQLNPEWISVLLYTHRTVAFGKHAHHNMALDHFMEHLNLICTTLHPGKATMRSMKKITSNLDILSATREQWRTVIRPLVLGGKRTMPKFDGDVSVVKHLILDADIFVHNSDRTSIVNGFVTNDWFLCDDIFTTKEAGPILTAVLQKIRVELGSRIEAEISVRASQFLTERAFVYKERQFSLHPKAAVEYSKAEHDYHFWDRVLSAAQAGKAAGRPWGKGDEDWRLEVLVAVACRMSEKWDVLQQEYESHRLEAHQTSIKQQFDKLVIEKRAHREGTDHDTSRR